MRRPTWDEYGLALAETTAMRAACSRRKVGAAIFDENHRVVSLGYNGAPSGMPDCLSGACPRGSLDVVAADSDYDHPGTPGFCIAAHAEANALIYAGTRSRGCTIFITDAPCPGCLKLLAAAGVARAVWPGGECSPFERLASYLA